MVKFVTEPEVSSVSVYFPGLTDQYWYDIETPLLYRGHSWQTVNVNLDFVSATIPTLYTSSYISFSSLSSTLLELLYR